LAKALDSATSAGGYASTEHRMARTCGVIAWNPVSSVTAAARHLFGNPNPSSSLHAWPMPHPVVAALAWSLAILIVFAPLAAHLFRRKTTG